MVGFRSTRDVGKLLGVPPSRLSRLVWDGRIPEPERGPGDSFCWTIEDINRASKALLGKPYKPSSAPAPTQTTRKMTLLTGGAV